MILMTPIAKAKVALAPGHYRLSATQQEDAIRKRQAAEQRESGQYRRLATDRKHMKKKAKLIGKGTVCFRIAKFGQCKLGAACEFVHT